MRTNLLQRIHGPSLVVKQGELNGIKSQVLDLVGRTKGDKFNVILDLDFAKQTMHGAVAPRTEGETKLSLTIHRDATQLLPILFDELNTDTMVSSGRDMLQEVREGTSSSPGGISPLA